MKNIVKILILLILVYTTLVASNIRSYIRQISHVNEDQQEVARFIIHNASKYNLKYTLLAIAFKESQWGKYRINLADPSAGIFHKMLPYYCLQLGLQPNKWNESRLAERLMNNDAESFMVALCDFKKDYRHFRLMGYSKGLAWRYSIQAYNAGINNYKAGYHYYKEIVMIIKALKHLGY